MEYSSSAILSGRCRTCLVDTSPLFNWNLPLKTEPFGKITYIECFRECTQIEVFLCDQFPQTICSSCAEQLCDAYCFIRKAKETNQILLAKQKSICISSSPVRKKDIEQETFEWVSVDKSDTALLPVKMGSIFNCSAPVELELEENNLDNYESESVDNHDCSSLPSPQKTNSLSVVDSKSTADISHLLTKKKRGRPKTKAVPQRIDFEAKSKVACKFCGKTFELEEIKSHIACDHKRQMLLCHACPRTFKDASSLRQHTMTHEENRERNYTCEQCGRKFFTKTAYQNHAKIHDTNRQAEFKCNLCEKSFFHKGSLKLHMQHHTGRTVECTICSKRYLRPIDLEIHLRSHSGDTPYKCQYCAKAFSQMGILNKHVRHHEGYRYKCDICDKEYLHQSTLIQHRKEHTGLPLKCSLCGKAFVKKSKLKRHIGGVHKVKDSKEMEIFIIKVKTKREYRGRILEME